MEMKVRVSGAALLLCSCIAPSMSSAASESMTYRYKGHGFTKGYQAELKVSAERNGTRQGAYSAGEPKAEVTSGFKISGRVSITGPRLYLFSDRSKCIITFHITPAGATPVEAGEPCNEETGPTMDAIPAPPITLRLVR